MNLSSRKQDDCMSKDMKTMFKFPYAAVVNPPKGGLTYNKLGEYLDEALEAINNKFKIVKNSKDSLQKMVDDGNLSKEDMQETMKTRKAIADRTIQIYKEILKKDEYTPEMKADLLRKINKVRVLMFFQMIRDDGELETDNTVNQSFLDEITAEVS